MPRRITLLFVATSCLISVLIPVFGDEHEPLNVAALSLPTITRRPWESIEDLRTRQALAKKIPSINFEATPFESAVEAIRHFWSINIVVHWEVLSVCAIEKDALVDLRVSNISGECVLGIMLQTTGGGETDLTFFIERGCVHITTLENANRYRIRWTYNCSDLLNTDMDHMERYLTDVFKAALKHTGRDPSMNSIEVERLVRSTYQDARQELREELADAIRISIDAESWYENGGNIGSIRFVGDQMVVVQSRNNQCQVFDFLEDLRSKKTAAAAGIGKWP
ncbi:MAG: hypothetical protein AABZ08_06065 [Planctomycetota bacterium]